jgi:hypothetical protein
MSQKPFRFVVFQQFIIQSSKGLKILIKNCIENQLIVSGQTFFLIKYLVDSVHTNTFAFPKK